MVRDYIFRTVLKKAPKERIEEMLAVVKCRKSVESFRNGEDFSFYDLLDLVDAVGIDIGLTIRVRGGEEVTFYPGQNFGETGGENGTPHEKRVAKKPYEPTVIAYERPARSQFHGKTSAHNPVPLVTRLSQSNGLYAQDDDEVTDSLIVSKVPKSREIPSG